VTDDLRKRRDSPPADSRSGGVRIPAGRADDASEESERPTVNPPFDVEAFARKATGGADPLRAPPEPPTLPPPPLAPSPSQFDAAEARSRRITLTNEVELEMARALSARSEPPRAPTPSALSIADARAPSVPAPDPASVPAPGPTPARSLSPTSIEAAVLGALGATSSSPPASAGPEITERTIEDPVAEMRERFSLGDYTGALEMAELILAEDPGHLEAAECGENCRTVLENMYAARLGSLDRVPRVVVPRTQMRWLSMDHRAGFILSLIDGSSTIEMILDVSGMPKLDALRILHELVEQKVVALR
jgi:hypothetical protein